ncbi:hypothetical protein [Cupriavidus numazuensis]|uniref:Uncharacterized protein n=1 Tax=Cupriavidus numazuensis TaxID=221992 RepID=A0ABN7PQY7_9BURK|nr:hypothetical protein [Cupriavidus numazuensis]CAG2132169.1 hypothetical protein LMG26411_00569 [Cupriavidus numazuensis]
MTIPATFQTLMPVCPHCGHEFDSDDMNEADEDLWSLAPDEGRASVVCPDAACGKEFHIQGGYRPRYTTAIDEDDL